MNTTRLSAQSLDIVGENVKKLRQLFPEIVTEDKIDFERLQDVLGNYIERNEESYRFTWYGKSDAFRKSQIPSTGTLRPCKDDSKDWDTTQNLYIEGDNLEVLKLLQKSYGGRVKMIYIDPPYNKDKDFVYPDKWSDPIKEYKRITGQLDDDGNATTSEEETEGGRHTKWLNMMYPRLRLARNLLTDDGVIFISIDDDEVENLKKLCNEVFGEENFVACIAWKRKKEISSDSKNVSIQGEYILTYSKSYLTQLQFEELSKEYVKSAYYDPTDKFPLGAWRPVPLTVSKGLSGGGYTYDIETPTGKVHSRLWAYPEASYKKLLAEDMVYFGKDDNGLPQRVMYAQDSKGQPATNYWDNVATNKEGKKEILSIFNDNYFDTPKPVKLVKKMLKLVTNNNDIILDFFSGSATTAHAVMQLNAEDGSNRRHIMVQMSEPCDKKSEAYKAGYPNICEIGKERIRRSGEAIKADLQAKYDAYIQKQPSLLSDDESAPMNPADLDVGFKVFKLDTSNLQRWALDVGDDFYNLNKEEQHEILSEKLGLYINNFVEGRSELDMLYEVMLKYGIDLSLPIETYTFNGENVYSVGMGALIVCLSDKLTESLADEVVGIVKELEPATVRVVARDLSFSADSIKTNFRETLKTGIEQYFREADDKDNMEKQFEFITI